MLKNFINFFTNFNLIRKLEIQNKESNLRGYLDHLSIDGEFITLQGWAINANGEAVRNFEIFVDKQKIAFWELLRTERKDVCNLIKNAEEYCGFEIKIKNTKIKLERLHLFASEDLNNKLLLKLSEPITSKKEIKKSLLSISNSKKSDNEKKSNQSLTLSVDIEQFINSVNFVAVYGMPNTGKTNFCNHFSIAMSDVLWVHTDEIFERSIFKEINEVDKFWISHPQPHFSISNYINSPDYDESLFVTDLSNKLTELISNNKNANLILLDGYVFKNHESIFNQLRIPNKRRMIVECKKNQDEVFTVSNIDVTNNKYELIETKILDYFKDACIRETLPDSHYQNFSLFGWMKDKNTASETNIKYISSHLDEVVKPNDRCVDIGCNAGYFVFMMAKKTKGEVWGVDFVSKWLEIASHIKCSIFHFTNVFFYKSDALDFLFSRKGQFEVIHCASTFHYFREKQKQFLVNAHQALSENGFLVIEVELAERDESTDVIKKARGVDSEPCYFPTRKGFLSQINGLFEIKAEYESTFQQGSFFNRRYFHLQVV
jgi:SAM-dependent methyltransferase